MRPGAPPLLLLLLAGALSACASSFREAVTPGRPGTPTAMPWRLNRELLMPVNQGILFVVEPMAGHLPELRALDELVLLAARYGGRPARWILHRQGEPFPLAADTSYVIVKYVADQLPSFGLAYSKEINGRPIHFLIINQEAHRRWRVLMPERRLEAQTLIHEYGHLLGLPPGDHGYYPKYPDFAGGMHCVNPDCPLSRPRPKAVLYNAFWIAFGRHYLEDYCSDCRAAIAAAQAAWQAGAVGAFDPTRPVPKPSGSGEPRG